MGVDAECVRFLVATKKAGIPFTDTLTLGRHWLFAKPKMVQECLASLGIKAPVAESLWADGLWKSLGAQKLDFMDHSSYEGATILQDLSKPVPKELHQSYDFVFDGGTLEHVYNFPVGIENFMNLCRTGGCVCLWTPANNECGHGFYQFSPELFFRLFSPINGFRLLSMILVEKRPFSSRWYEVRDPADINARVCCVNRHPLFMMILAKKTRELEPGGLSVFQSDYIEAWDPSQQGGVELPLQRVSRSVVDYKRWLRAIQKKLPRRMAETLLGMYSTYVVRRLANRAFFRRVNKFTYLIVD